jgi:predicted lipoprotein with Yx(FWY)xxD motif
MHMTNEHGTTTTRFRMTGWAPRLALTLTALVVATLSTASLIGPAGAASTKKVILTTSTIPSAGKVVVVNGKAVYTLTPSATPCDAACLKIWPAVTLPAHVARATAGKGVSKSALGVTTGPGGVRQVTYHGKPVYWFAHDTKGHVNGNVTDQWGKWTAVVVSTHGTGGTPTTSSGTAGSGGASF